MSKKNEVSHASSHAHGAAAPAEPTAAQLVERYTREAALSAADKVKPTIKPRLLARAAKKIAAIQTRNPKLYAALLAGKFNTEQLAAIGTLGVALAAALKPTPPNRATTKLLTPAQKQFISAAAARLSKALEAVQPVARALRQLDDAKALGRASDVGDSPDSVQTAIEMFQSNAHGLLPLLEDAGVDADYRASLARDLAELETIADAKQERVQEKSDAGQAILEAALAVEIAFLFFRGRVNSRLQADPVWLGKALGYLPRRPEQRKKAAATGEAGDETGEDDHDDEKDEEGDDAAVVHADGQGEEPGADAAGQPVKKDASGKAKSGANGATNSP